MRVLISILILFSSLSVFSQLQIDMKSANQKYERAFLDVHELKQLLSITTEVSTSELAQRFADFLYTSPLTVRGMGGSYPDEKGGKHIYRMHPALQIDEPMNEYFLLAYIEFFKKEVETIVALAPKILPYSQSPGGHKEYKIRESVYGCLQTMAIDTTVEDCLNEWRPHLVKDQNVLSTFVSSYIRLYRASRLYFANYKPVDIQGLPSGLENLCPYITGKYLELENKKADFLTKRSWWNGLEQFYVYNTFPELFYIAGSSFSFSLAPKEVPTGDRGLRFLCTVPQYMFSKMNMRN